MAKILLLSSGLHNSYRFTDPFLKRLEAHLRRHNDCVDVRNVSTFDERTFFEYDQVVFIFLNFFDALPSSTLEIFKKLEGIEKNHTEIYGLIACDEYEPEKCDISEKILKQWCLSENLQYKGSLKIGSALFIMKSITKFVVSDYLKTFAHAILKHDSVSLKVTMLTDRIFMNTANKYWNKEIRKIHKEKIKNKKKVF